MATTSSIQATKKTMVAGRSGDSKHNKGRMAGLVAITALGLGLLGGSIAQGWQATPTAQSSVNPFAGDTHVYSMWDFREDRRAGAYDLFLPDQFTYREDRRVELAPVSAASAFVPDQFTYREDRRVEGASQPWSPDFWTYREDRRER